MSEYNISIWDGNPGPISGSTPFGYFDNESIFQTEGPQVAKWCASRLGYPVIDIELQSGSFYACFEQAICEYSALINSFLATDNMYDAYGLPTSVNLDNNVLNSNFTKTIEISKNYANEIGAGGTREWKSGSFTTVYNQQLYDLNDLWANVSESGDGIEIQRVYHEEPPAIGRYFDPYAGTGVGSQYIMTEFGWGQYSPGINFVMMPIFEDLLRLQAIEFNSQIRRSQYSFEVIDNKIKIYPIPTTAKKIWFNYTLTKDRYSDILTAGTGSGQIITSPGNIPYSRMQYSNINSQGRQWIKEFTLALSRESLGLVRGKYQTIPVPGEEVSMDGGDLRSEGITRQQELIQQLKDDFEKLGKMQQLEIKRMESEVTNEILNRVPLKIYIR